MLFGFFEGWFFRFDPNFPISSNILLFALINLNAILLLLLAYFVLRNIVKLVFERKRNILGHKLRTRLIIAFIGLTLTPTLPLFLIATQFISSSLDYWFSSRVEHSLEQAVTIGQAYLQEEQDEPPARLPPWYWPNCGNSPGTGRSAALTADRHPRGVAQASSYQRVVSVGSDESPGPMGQF